MKNKKVGESQRPLFEKAQEMEERLFGKDLHADDRSFMQSDRYFWHFRPSHHIATGLLTQEDVTLLSQPGKRLLSVGAFPAHLERLLVELGVPSANIVVADKDPAIIGLGNFFETLAFDALDAWPDIGTFDRIIFPECLCTILAEGVKESEASAKDDCARAHPTDALEATLLGGMWRKALDRLRLGGIIRANGPMSHPNVIAAASAHLRGERRNISIESRRYFLSMQCKEEGENS